AWLALGDTIRAEEHLKKAVALHPLSAFIRNEIAGFYEATFRPEDALENQRAATRIYPLKGEYHYNLARILRKSGKIEEAKRAAREAARVELEPALKSKYQILMKELSSP
ncbi:tetratricopeptide repeat protein, partial [Candidatus Sumerlaeota bacterium]|nr:tetratricopeptide repeat protein [Candidatus Sumerlaeota bacterium]